MAIDLSTAVGKVRNLIADKIEENFRFTDAEIQAFLDGEDVNGNVKLAAADAQDATAADQTLLLLVMKKQKGELETDGEKVALALQRHANTLRAQGRRTENAKAGNRKFTTSRYTPSTWP